MDSHPLQSRSEHISQGFRRRLPWDGDQPFKILSIDGGGIKGIFPATILSTLEKDYLDGRPIGDYFDLIAGTSTGGIIALGLGAGLSATEIERMYMDEGHLVFPSTRRGLTGKIRRFFRARYDRKALDELLSNRVGGKTLRESKYRLLVPATEGENGEVWVYKTPHHPDYKLDGNELMSSVASATSSAPTYFAPFRNKGYAYLDGGIWANNPTMAALVEAFSCFDVQPENVRILSLGCGGKPFQMTDGQAKSSGLIHWYRVFEVQMHLQSETAINQAGLLIGRKQVTRLDRPEGSEPIEMDDWSTARGALPSEARQVLREHADHIAKTFLTQPASPFTPLA